MKPHPITDEPMSIEFATKWLMYRASLHFDGKGSPKWSLEDALAAKRLAMLAQKHFIEQGEQ